MSDETTFEKAKVGDRVWWYEGNMWGIIYRVDLNDDYQLTVDFSEGSRKRFTSLGSYAVGLQQTLFWDEISIVAPPRPKRKLKKVLEAKAIILKNGDIYLRMKDDQDFVAEHIVIPLRAEYEVDE